MATVLMSMYYQGIFSSCFLVVSVVGPLLSCNVNETRKLITLNIMSSTMAKENLNQQGNGLLVIDNMYTAPEPLVSTKICQIVVSSLSRHSKLNVSHLTISSHVFRTSSVHALKTVLWVQPLNRQR